MRHETIKVLVQKGMSVRELNVILKERKLKLGFGELKTQKGLEDLIDDYRSEEAVITFKADMKQIFGEHYNTLNA